MLVSVSERMSFGVSEIAKKSIDGLPMYEARVF